MVMSGFDTNLLLDLVSLQQAVSFIFQTKGCQVTTLAFSVATVWLSPAEGAISLFIVRLKYV